MRLTAVDIGSNAIRLLISQLVEYEDIVTFKKLEYIRFPLRLGQEVFFNHKITPPQEEKFVKLMQTFRSLLELYEVQDYYFVGTSAMREAQNGENIVKRVKNELGIDIDIISGGREAELINEVIKVKIDENPYIHIDVGGGSTELMLYRNRRTVASASFDIGTVRVLDKHAQEQAWQQMRSWIRQNTSSEYQKIKAIGTGGNISKIHELANKKDDKPLTAKKIREIKDYVAGYSYQERVNKLLMNPDRADVILPAADIYMNAMHWANASKILVPSAGLKEGIIQMLYNRNTEDAAKDLVMKPKKTI